MTTTTTTSAHAAPSIRLFMSHTHEDQALAHSLRDLFQRAFGEHVTLTYSSDPTAGGGVTPGMNWLEWISDAVRESELTLVLLTPRSVGKPWILWESGAVAGAALATGNRGRIVPVLYRMQFDDIPEPMRALQAVRGENKLEVLRLLQRVNGATINYLPRAFENICNAEVPLYLTAVNDALVDQPLLLDEAQVGEWVTRLEKLRAEKRSAEVGHLHQALRIATEGAGGPGLLDLRIHRRLGEMYLEGRKPALAIEQFELATKLAPRDIYLLHQLGIACLENRNIDKATRTLEKLVALEATIAEANPEIAGFKGRLYREKWRQGGNMEDLRKARDAYAVVLDSQPDSYFLADNVGQLSLGLGEKDRAKSAFQQAKSIIERTGERSVWSLATLATSALVLGEDIGVHLKAIHAVGPAPREVDSIVGGLERVQQSLGLSADLLVGWRRMLTTGAE